MRRPPNGAGGRRVDLHAHTIFSDGLLSPEDLVARAARRGLAALAITDHDSVEALPRARAAAPPGLEIVPGVEISAAMDDLDVHLLGYFVDPDHAGLRARLDRFHGERQERVREIARRLGDLGLPIDVDRVMAAAGPGVVGRPHVAAAMVEAGLVTDFDQAFRSFLSAQGAAYVPRPHFDVREAIELIHAASGVSVLAHPGPTFADDGIERLVQIGLRGVEVWHPLHGTAAVRRYRGLAERWGLVETGGSDFHGPQRGTDLGDVPVPATVLERLKEVAGVTG